VTATFDHREVRIERGPDLILRGDRNPITKVYEIKVEAPPSLSACPVISHHSHADLVRYHYTALGCPVWSTFIDAISSGILSLPGLTLEIARRNQQCSIPSALGHLSLHRKGVRPTKPKPGRGHKPGPKRQGVGEPLRDGQHSHTHKPSAAPVLATPTHTTQLPLTDDMDISVVTCDDTFLDGTGAFPVQSRRGVKYVLVSTRRGYIHLILIPSRTAQSQAKRHAAALQFWTSQGMRPLRARFDNETSAELEAL
jgi:hypothetical protein